MIDRVELQNVMGYLAELEEKKKRQVQEERRENQGVSVEISNRLTRGETINYEDLSKRVENIRSQLQRNTYEVSPEKILHGLEKFLSSR